MITQAFALARETVSDAVDAAVDALTLSEYGFEAAPQRPQTRACEERRHLIHRATDAFDSSRDPRLVS